MIIYLGGSSNKHCLVQHVELQHCFGKEALCSHKEHLSLAVVAG